MHAHMHACTHTHIHTYTHIHTHTHTHTHIHTCTRAHTHSIKHPREVPGKSTATHARVLAPDNVSIHIFPDVPAYPDISRVILVYPNKVRGHTHT